MTRIAPDTRTPTDRDMIKATFGKIPPCQKCDAESTIWIRLYGMEDLFLCDLCAFHLARILMQDIGHSLQRLRK